MSEQGLQAAHDKAAERLLEARASVYAAFNSLDLGFTAQEAERWFLASPAGQSFREQGGKAFGAALGTALVAVEADRALPATHADARVLGLSDRELNAIKWSVPILRGVESQFGELAGTREGEATSDVLAGIVARADLLGGEQHG